MDDLETLVKKKHDNETARSGARPIVRMVDPKSILPSLFDDRVNTVATEEEDKALRASIDAKGVQVSITAGRVGGQGPYYVVKGTRRHRLAIELGIEKIPVEYKEYDSLAEMEQDALEDNLVRRQYDMAARAKQGYVLWQASESPDARKALAERGITPRKHASISSGITETLLAYYRSVQDGGNPDLIARMEAGKIAISAAYNQMKKELAEGTSQGEKKERTAQFQSLLETFDELVKSLKKVSGLTVQVEEIKNTLDRVNKSELQRITKKFNAVAKVIAECEAEGSLSKLHAALTPKATAPATPDGKASE